MYQHEIDPMEVVARAIQSRDEYARELQRVQQNAQMLPWYSFLQRHSLQQDMGSLRSRIEASEQRIDPVSVLDIAYQAGGRLWGEAAQTVIPKKNIYGRAALEHFEEILELALKGRETVRLWIGRDSFELSSLTDVIALLSEDFLRTNARRIITERLAVAASTDFLQESFENTDGHQVTIIQHAASGLRAVFTVRDDGYGSVYAKPYRIKSIDPENPGTAENWEMYAGLGIGEKIYREAHRLMPDVRWSSHAITTYSARLRQKLHFSDPYIWSANCPWCGPKLDRTRIYSWDKTDRDFFIDHPRTI